MLLARFRWLFVVLVVVGVFLLARGLLGFTNIWHGGENTVTFVWMLGSFFESCKRATESSA